MATSIIHLAIAKQVKEKYNQKIKNPKDFYLGAIAPDISKQIGESKEKSHFLINTTGNIPNIAIFIKKYPYYKTTSFDLGYFTHLYTDKLWHEEFLPNIKIESSIKLANGDTINATKEEIQNMIYSDYTNLNKKTIEEYDLDLSLFYEEFTPPRTNIKEIPIEDLDILINKMGILIENSNEEKTYIIDFEEIKSFINTTSNKIIEILNN